MNGDAMKDVILTNLNDYGLAMLGILGAILVLSVGFLVFRKGYLTLMNDPDGWNYDSKRGSYGSRHNKVLTDADAGGHMKSYRF